MGVVWHSTLLSFYGEPRRRARDLLVVPDLRRFGRGRSRGDGRTARAGGAVCASQHGRATGTFVLPGELAAYLIVLLPIAYALARISRERVTAGCGVGGSRRSALPALALTYSRAGWMGFAAAAAFLRRRADARDAATRDGALRSSWAARRSPSLLLFNAHHDPSEDYTRISIWQAALQIIDRFPLTGVGPFDFSRLYALVHVPTAKPSAFHAHSLYLTFFAEFGTHRHRGVRVDWLAFRAGDCARGLRRREPDAALLALALTAGLVGVAVQGLIDTMSIVIFGLWLPTMALALAAAGHGEYRRRPERMSAASASRCGCVAALLVRAAIRRRRNRRPRRSAAPPSRRPRAPPLHITGQGSAGAPVRFLDSASPKPRRVRI